MKKVFSLLVVLCSVIWQSATAQTDLQAPLPQDSQTVVGKLPNGITYYLRHNEEPKERASFYIIRNAGALLENDDQNGLAHFLEHMSFNGTKNFPGKGIISTLEKYGIAFGRNINAYTTHNETVYNISSVPTTNESLLDTCLLILHDWSYYVSLEDEEIDAERGVISEEWRSRRTSGTRIQQQTFPVLFKDSKYAVRDVIGSLDVIQNFKYQTIKDFYRQWYRTDLEAIAIVGDFNVARMEQKVKELFSKIPAVENPTPRPFFDIPEHEQTYYVLGTDKEATKSSISLIRLFKDASPEEKNTHAYIRNNLIQSFYNQMLNARISEIMQQANPPFLGGQIGFSGFVRGYNAYDISTTAKPNQEDIALETILTENERAKRFGFTENELERVKTNALARLESAYKQKDKTNNENYIEEMKSHFLENEPMVSMDDYYHLAKSVIPTITVQEVSAKAREWNQPGNWTTIITGPSENTRHLTEAEVNAIREKVDKADIEPFEDKINATDLISEELPGAKITATKQLPEFDAVEWTLANGAKVIFRKADYEKDNVTLTSYSKGGTSLYDTDMLPSAENTSSFVGAFGIGDFDVIALKKLLTGKMVSSGVAINGLYESVNGSSTPKDFETLLQLTYLRFEKPRFDSTVFESILNRNRAMLPNMLKNPQKIMQDSLQLIMSNYNPRVILFNEDYLNRLSLEKIEQVYRDRIKDASDFTFFIVGNIDETTVKPLVEKYIGSLRSQNRKENWKDNHVRGPKGKTVKEIELQLETPKATVITQFEKELKHSVHNNVCNKIVEGILELRYTENIREKEGGTYGVDVQASSSREPYSCYSMTMSFECDPEKAEYLKSLIYKETERLTEEAPSTEEMNKVISNLLKNREQSKHHNSFWLNALYSYYISGINSADPRNYEQILNKITAKDIQKFAKTLFKEADVRDITFKPKA